MMLNSEIEYHPPFGGANDSSYIVFDENKQIIYLRNDGKARNILNINNYNKVEVTANQFEYQYFISDEDYENATSVK